MSEDRPQIQLQKLAPWHKDVLSLAAQGVDRRTIGAQCDCTPEYVTWLLKQSVCQEYLQEMAQIVDFRLAVMTERSVDVISDVMQEGTNEDRLKAAKLQLETVGRIGRNISTPQTANQPDRLEQLAQRLVVLLQTNRERVINGTAQIIEED